MLASPCGAHQRCRRVAGKNITLFLRSVGRKILLGYTWSRKLWVELNLIIWSVLVALNLVTEYHGHGKKSRHDSETADELAWCAAIELSSEFSPVFPYKSFSSVCCWWKIVINACNNFKGDRKTHVLLPFAQTLKSFGNVGMQWLRKCKCPQHHL